jgi:hypothetical protein
MNDGLTLSGTSESYLEEMLPIPVAKPSPKERATFYRIALDSLRECEAIFQLLGLTNAVILEQEDKLARHLYKLCKALE